MAAPSVFAKVVKVTNQTGLWDAKQLTGFASILWSTALSTQSFRPTQHYLIVEVLSTWAKFLELFGHSTVIHSTFIFLIANGFGCICDIMSQVETWNTCSQIRFCCIFIYAAFKSNKEWTNAQHISTPTTIIQPPTAGTVHKLELLQLHDICATITSISILLQNFWLILVSRLFIKALRIGTNLSRLSLYVVSLL